MISVFGSINLDLIGRVARIPAPGETVPGDSFATAPGGKGANQALAARRAGASVRMIGAAGSDAMGDDALRLLAEAGVDLAAVRRVASPQGVAMIMVDTAGENIIGILPGANAEVSVADAEMQLAGLGQNDVLVVQQEIEQGSTIRALSMARERGTLSVLNTAPFLATTHEAAKRADVVIANETEFELLLHRPPDRETMRNWVAQTGRAMIVTLGPRGAWAEWNGGSAEAAAPAIAPLDTVGAGDTFVGYLAAGLDNGAGLQALPQVLPRAVMAASLACLKAGAQPAIPTAAEVEAARA